MKTREQIQEAITELAKKRASADCTYNPLIATLQLGQADALKWVPEDDE